MMKKIKFVYFDIGGVLVDHVLALRNIAREFGVSEERIISLFYEHCNTLDKGVLSWSSFEKIIYDKLNPSNKLEKSLVEFFVDNFGVIQETHDLINEIEGSVDIGILSNVSEDVFQLIRLKNLIPDIDYKAIVKSAEIKLVKPEKEIFDYAFKQVNVLPQEILFVDDSEVNVRTARLLGWNVVLFDTQNPVIAIKEIKSVL